MKVRSLQLEGFRNVREAELEFGDKTLLVGQNGAGKTSLAEAVCVGLNGRSFRTSDTNTVLQKGAPYWRTAVRAERRDGVEHCIVITTSPLRRERMQIDEQNVRITQLNAQYPVVTFVPEDRDIITGLPSVRREYLDGILVRCNPLIQRRINRASRLLKQRQNLIRSTNIDFVTLDVFDEELAQASIVISEARAELLEKLRTSVQDFNNGVTDLNEQIDLRYEPSWKNDPLKELIEARSDDIRRGSTSVGFHRDDFRIELNGLPAKSTASQGQVRSLAIALRVGSAQVIKEEIKEAPLLILDDVFSEFDRDRAARLVRMIGQYQTIATNTEATDSASEWSVVEVSGGRIVSQ